MYKYEIIQIIKKIMLNVKQLLWRNNDTSIGFLAKFVNFGALYHGNHWIFHTSN